MLQGGEEGHLSFMGGAGSNRTIVMDLHGLFRPVPNRVRALR